MIIETFEQYSPEWWSARTGTITMSNAKTLIMKGRGGVPSITREKYLLDLVAERLSGKPIDAPIYPDQLRGLELERYAIQAYEEATGVDVERIGFVWLDEDRRIGGSPDGVVRGIVAGDLGSEIKCPQPRAHIKWVMDPDGNGHMEQIQGYMWLMDLELFDFVSYCPEVEQLPLFIHQVHRDEQMIKSIAMQALVAVEEIDNMLERISAIAEASYDANNPRLRDIRIQALRHLDSLFNDGEVKIDE